MAKALQYCSFSEKKKLLLQRFSQYSNYMFITPHTKKLYDSLVNQYPELFTRNKEECTENSVAILDCNILNNLESDESDEVCNEPLFEHV